MKPAGGPEEAKVRPRGVYVGSKEAKVRPRGVYVGPKPMVFRRCPIPFRRSLMHGRPRGDQEEAERRPRGSREEAERRPTGSQETAKRFVFLWKQKCLGAQQNKHFLNGPWGGVLGGK